MKPDNRTLSRKQPEMNRLLAFALVLVLAACTGAADGQESGAKNGGRQHGAKAGAAAKGASIEFRAESFRSCAVSGDCACKKAATRV